MTTQDFSLLVCQWGTRPPSLAELVKVAVEAEELGYYSIGIPHVPLLPHKNERPAGSVFEIIPPEYGDYQLDALVVVPALLSATSRIKVGFNVLVTPWVHPFVWAKYIASLDHAFDGRVIAGFGLGYAPVKQPVKALRAVGIVQRGRGAMSDEALEVIIKLWRDADPFTFDGQFYKGERLVVEPKPIRKPYPELWWAGEALPSVTRAAKYADYLELSWPTIERIEKCRDELQRQNTAVDGHASIAALVLGGVTDSVRSRAQIQETFIRVVEGYEPGLESAITGPPDHCAELLTQYRQAGASHFVLDLNRHGQDSTDVLRREMEAFASRVIPLL